MVWIIPDFCRVSTKNFNFVDITMLRVVLLALFTQILYNIIINFIKIYIIFMDSTTIFISAVAGVIILITAFSIYTSFGPPSKELADPFDDHDD
jgi:PsbN protein